MIEIRQQLEFRALSLIAGVLKILPRKAAIRFGESLGGLLHRIGIRTDVARENLSKAFPDWKPEVVHDTVRRCYRHFGALLAEFARLSKLKAETLSELIEVEGLDVLDETVANGKGGIVVSGHFGNWELMGASAAVKGYPVAYVVTRQQNKQVEALMDNMRASVGIEIIKRRNAIKGVLGAMKDNKIVAILSDQDAHEAGAFVPFFGRLASTPKGAATFAIRSGARLIFAESYRRDLDRLKVIFEPVPMDDLPEDNDQAIAELTRRFTARLEEAVRHHPEQWFWMHRRWKTSPPGEQA